MMATLPFFVLVKYDFWLNHLTELRKAKIPVILISGLFRPNQIFFKWYGGLFKKTLKGFNHFFLQNEESALLLKNIGIEQTTVNGDTRVDSVLENVPIAIDKLPNVVKEFVKGNKCLVVGSSYAAEEQIIAQNLSDCLANWKILIAPHNINDKHLEQIETLFGVNATFLSKTGNKTPETQVFIIDQIGLLKYLYFLADIAFVGGGFGKTVHNTLEPAAFGIPILFGPKFQAFPEAVELVLQNGAFSLKNETEFSEIFKQLNTERLYKAAANVSRNYILKNSHSSGFVINWINQFHSIAKT